MRSAQSKSPPGKAAFPHRPVSRQEPPEQPVRCSAPSSATRPQPGRRTGRRLEREPRRTWATPLETLLIAERAALLSGRDDDFTLIITIGYTGLRWGEAIGLELGYVNPAEIHVEWQLHELRGKFHRLPPKDDSYRSPGWEPKLPVDLPDF